MIDLKRVGGLKGITLEDGSIIVGATTTHNEVASSALVKSHLPVLSVLAGGIGDQQVPHRGTIGGSVANNDPAADYPAGCLGLGATIITSRRMIAADLSSPRF